VTSSVIANAEHEGGRADIAVANGRIAAIEPHLDVPAGATRFDARGGAVLPGLHDHHIHLLAAAAALESIDVRPVVTPNRRAFETHVQAAARAAARGAWLRAVGYHERIAGDLDRAALDAIVRDHPLRVQHRSGALWMCNTAALDELGILAGPFPAGCELDDHGVPTGRLFRLDEWMRDRMPVALLDIARLGNALARSGITGVTDATPYATIAPFERLARAVESGELPLHVQVTGVPSLAPAALPRPLAVGPAKLLLPDHTLPSLDDVVELIREARAHGRAIAVHCVTRVALVLTLAALEAAGPETGDRIEHGAVIGPDLLPLLHRAGVTVVTQPNFVAERGDDYLADVEPEDRDHLWPCASLLAAGIAVAAGSDAPHGEIDTWQLLHAAVERRTPHGRVVGADERLSPRRALDLLLAPLGAPGAAPRRVEVGAPADLCVLGVPLATALRELPANPVQATFVAGTLTCGPDD
jgi:predicted amidohydrolase YtcJ